MTCTPSRLLSAAVDELFDRPGVADGFVHLPEVVFDLLGLDGVLSEDAARRLLTLGGLVDLAGDVGLGRRGFVKVTEVELELLLVALSSESGGRD